MAAVVVSGLIAAIVAVILPMAVPERLLVAPDYAVRETIIVLVGVVVGGIDRLWSATLGGFAIGFAVGALSGFLPSSGSWPFTSSVYLDAAVFMLVIIVLLLRPEVSSCVVGGWQWSGYEASHGTRTAARAGLGARPRRSRGQPELRRCRARERVPRSTRFGRDRRGALRLRRQPPA